MYCSRVIAFRDRVCGFLEAKGIGLRVTGFRFRVQVLEFGVCGYAAPSMEAPKGFCNQEIYT